MSTSNAIRFMQNDSGSDEYGIGLKIFFGSVVEAFTDSTVFFNDSYNVIEKLQLSNSNSGQFLIVADTPDAEDHTPGDELMGQSYAFGDGTIAIDNFVVAHHDVPLDQLLAGHIKPLSILGKKMGKRLARNYDQKLFNLLANTARLPAATHTATGLTLHNGGNRVEAVHASGVTSAFPVSTAGAQAFRAKAAELAEMQDNDNVPEGGRLLFITPYIRRVLSMDPTIYDVRYNRNDTPNRLNSRAIGELEGFVIVPVANRILDSNITSYRQTKYNGDYRYNGATGQPVALAACGASEGSAAIGTVMLQNILTEMEKDIRRSTMFIKASILMGAGSLHPWCAGSIEVDDS